MAELITELAETFARHLELMKRYEKADSDLMLLETQVMDARERLIQLCRQLTDNLAKPLRIEADECPSTIHARHSYA